MEGPCPGYRRVFSGSVNKFLVIESNKPIQEELARPIEPAKIASPEKTEWFTLKEIPPGV